MQNGIYEFLCKENITKDSRKAFTMHTLKAKIQKMDFSKVKIELKSTYLPIVTWRIGWYFVL